MSDGNATVPAFATIQSDVKAAVSASTSTVRQRVVEQLVEVAIADRTACLVKAMEKRRNIEGDMRKKDKPDTISYNSDGTVASSTYTKQTIDDLNGLRSKLKKLDEAFDDAVNNGNFEKLKNLVAE